MRIGIQSWGSEGDVRPLIALSRGLRAAGHAVTMVITSTENKDFGALCNLHDLAYLKVPAQAEFDVAGMADDLKKCKNKTGLVKHLIRELFLRYLEDMSLAARELCGSNDLVIGHYCVAPLKLAAVKLRRPFVSVILFRGGVPSIFRPPGRWPNLGPLGNSIEWKFVQVLVDLFGKRELESLWRREGLAPPPHVLPGAWSSEILNLIGASRIFCPPQPDWRTLFRVCGYFWLPDQLEPAKIAPDLSEFLKVGEAPVYMTCGLLEPFYGERWTELAVEAADLASCRSIIQTTSLKYPSGTRRGNIFFIDRTDHHSVFPQCAAVVYHGGGGTAHSATFCGRPSIIAGFSHEHMAYGHDLHRLGAGSKPLRFKSITPKKLAQKICQVLGSPRMQRRASELGEIMRQEDGIGQAVGYIHQLEAVKKIAACR